MCESETTPATTETAPLQENKRVNYSRGMVLGEDDFRQEQLHLEWQDHLANRLLHGYGTVCGLDVSHRIKPGTTDTLEVMIGGGYALSPSGRWIWVEEAQCAPLDTWIQANRSVDFNAPDNHRVYVKLCYVECPVDDVPIAGQACAPEQENMAPSRILETFHAELSWEAPDQAAEDYMSAFGRLLRRIVIVAEDSSPLEPDESDYFLDLVRNLPDISPPDDDSLITLHESTACQVIHEALTIWVLEVCPRLEPSGDEDCILLACVDFSVDEAGILINDSVEIENCDRPLLIPTRLQQELFCLLSANTDHGSLEGLLDDDHPQYLLTDGSRPLAGPWSAGNNLIYDLAPGTTGGDAIRYDQAIKIGDPAGGDLGGFYPDPLVTGLQGRRVADIEPDPDAVLTWNDYTNQWEPQLHQHFLGDLEDVSDADPDPDAVLTWVEDEDEGHWEPQRQELGDHVDVSDADPGPGAVLTWNDGREIWEPRLHDHRHEHELDDLEDVDASAPNDGDSLVFRYGRWVPELIEVDPGPNVNELNDLDDVNFDIITPQPRDVLTYDGTEWVPQPVPGGTTGNYVQAPAGDYAIVAAGHFEADGSSFLGRQTYNDLEAQWLGEGIYRLWFPLYPTLLSNIETITLIIKGTIFDPQLPEKFDDPNNVEIREDMPASFQVVNFTREGILVWVTQPVLTFETIMEIIQGGQNFPPEFNVLHFMPTNRSFMVEISAYGDLELPEIPPPSDRVNLNTATETELRTLPGIGPTLARRILRQREASGGFTSILDLRAVNGIDDGLIGQLALLVSL